MKDAVRLEELARLVARRIGLRIPDEAHDRFSRILHEHAKCRGHATLEDYLAFLASEQATEEWEELARVLTSSETFFFRDHGQFDLLRLRLLPELIERHRLDQTLHLWSAGCASGEEAYSLAILVDMVLPARDGWNIIILGTDIDSRAIARAQRGRYGRWSFRMVPPEIQQRYFHQEGDEWVLDERIRRMVTFRVSNLVSEPFPAASPERRDMDLILCRNVFIYLDPAAICAVASKFAATLREGGYLLTAHTELIAHRVPGLESRLFAEGMVYQASAGSTPLNRKTTWIAPPVTRHAVSVETETAAEVSVALSEKALLEEARAHADRGDFDQAEQVCHQALDAEPLAAAPYFLLAQLAQIRGDFDQAKECLNRALYLHPQFVAAYLELATLCERTEDLSRAQALRRVAHGIVSTMPHDDLIEQYEITAGELTRWLAQWERMPAESFLDAVFTARTL